MSQNHTNPLLDKINELPQFDRFDVKYVEEAVKEAIKQAEAIVVKVEKSPPSDPDALVRSLEEVSRLLESAWGPVDHLFGVKNTETLRSEYEKMQPLLVQFGLRLSQSQSLYKAYKSAQDALDRKKTPSALQRAIDLSVKDAELSGVALAEAQKKEYNEIQQKLSQLSTQFSNHVLDATKAFEYIIEHAESVKGMPESFLEFASQSFNESKAERANQSNPTTGPWRVTLDVPSYLPVMEHCSDRGIREALYRGYISRASQGKWDNGPLMLEILQLRKRKAEILGFKSYAELSLARKMAPSVAKVEDLSEQLLKASLVQGKKDLAELQDFAKQKNTKEPLEYWDIAFWRERLREERFGYSEESLRPYFPLDKVLNGLFDLVHKIFGITVKNADGTTSVWDSKVHFFHVLDQSNKKIAAFYLDTFARPGEKRGGAWMNDCKRRCILNDGSIQIPVAYLVCNNAPAAKGKPATLNFDEIITLFHEFGHGLHHMLTKVDVMDVAGISGVEWDAVELPSQFMENWCYHKPTLKKMSKHIETGEELPDELFDKIYAAKNYQAASMMLRQLQFGMIDMELHYRLDPSGGLDNIWALQERIASRTSVMPPAKDNRFLCSFSHIFAGGYAAGYYSYKWAEVLSADAFAAFEEAGLDDAKKIQETGKRYRDTILALGGSEHPMDVFKKFRGREPRVDALLRHSGIEA